MEFIKEEIEDILDPEPSRIKHEDTETQTDRMEVKQEHKLEEVEEDLCNFKTQKDKAKTQHTCSHCGKSFSKTSSLSNHLRIHTGEKSFNCDECGKTFISSSHLRKHLKVHSGERPHLCSVCGKSFSRLDHFKQHQKTHNEARDHVCSECGKSFTTAEYLKLHQRIHTGEKPFKCSHCDKSFIQSGHLKVHERLHTGEKPYHCTQCEKSFKDAAISLHILRSRKSSALETMEDIEKVFTELICSLEKKRSEIKEQIRAQEKTEIDRAEELHKHLDQELTELRKRQAEIEKLLITDDQVIFLKSCQTVCVLPTFEDVPITQHTRLYFKDISISAFREVLEDVYQQQTAKISQEVSNVRVAKTQNDFLQYFCELHLDPNTAHNKLELSEDNRKISCTYKDQQYPYHPERFDRYIYILCRESLCDRCYWEVECSGDKWAVAVCYKGIGRKGDNNDYKLGFNKISWKLSHYEQNIYFTHDKSQVSIPAVCSSRIGVYLDHRAGTLSFYSVSDTMTLLHRVQTTFTEPLYPAFFTGQGSSVRIIEEQNLKI